MFTVGYFRNNENSQNKRELNNAKRQIENLQKGVLPKFSYGSKHLGFVGKDEKKELELFVEDWFKNPEQYLNYKKFSKNNLPIVISNFDKGEKCYSFKSFVDKKDKAQFYESKQPFYGRGEKIAFIILPHWNAYFSKYKSGTAVIRNCFLPVATYRYFPKYSTEEKYLDKSRYDIVGSNIGLTIKRFWQDILNIQRFGDYLKNELGYQKVGIWTYSIGSPRGYLASMFSKGIFDFLIMNFLSDSFSWSLLHGISTQDISKELLKYLDEKEINYLFSPLSPGKYIKYLNRLPKYTRLVQAKYDLVFGEKNNEKMINKFRKFAPFVNIEYGNYGHTTYGELDKVFGIVNRNSEFVWRNSGLKL